MRTALRILLAGAAGCTAVVGCRPAPVDRSDLDTERPVVERRSDTLVIHWRGAPRDAAVPVYAAVTPDGFDRNRPVARLEAGRVEIRGLDPRVRHYFELAPPGGPALQVAERRLPLEGAHNFRDLGGYATSDGRTVRWGRLFRSDALAELTERDLAYVSRLGLRLVCDFRSPKEREAAPDRLPDTYPPRVATLGIYDESFDPALLRERILSGDLDGLDLAQLLVEGNRAFVTDARQQYAGMFGRLSEPGNLPALVHCTAGKDRAGFASAIVLLALGVDRESVLEDFMLTNVYTAEQIEKTLRRIRLFSFFRTDPEQVRPILGVRREYLEAGLDEIDKRFGSVEAYLSEGLGVTDAARERMRELLLLE